MFLQAIDGAGGTVLGNPLWFGILTFVLVKKLRGLPAPIHALLLKELPTATTLATCNDCFAVTCDANRGSAIRCIRIGLWQWLPVAIGADLLAVLTVRAGDLAQTARHDDVPCIGCSGDLGGW